MDNHEELVKYLRAGTQLRPYGYLYDQAPAIEAVRQAIEKYDIQTVNDVGCGAFSKWMAQVIDNGVGYNGYDLNPDVITTNQNEFPEKHFEVKDAVYEELPFADLCVVRNLIFHLTFADSKRLLLRLKCNYLLATSHDLDSNADGYRVKSKLANWGYRPVDLCKPPFNFGQPLEKHHDKNPHDDNRYLCLWSMNNV